MIIFYRTAATLSALNRRLLNENRVSEIEESDDFAQNGMLELLFEARDRLSNDWYVEQSTFVSELQARVKDYYRSAIEENVELHTRLGTFDRLTPGSNQIPFGYIPLRKRLEILSKSVHRMFKRWAEHDTVEKQDADFWKHKFENTRFGRALLYSDAMCFEQLAHNFIRTDARDYEGQTELNGLLYNDSSRHNYFYIRGLTDKFYVKAQAMGVEDAYRGQ